MTTVVSEKLDVVLRTSPSRTIDFKGSLPPKAMSELMKKFREINKTQGVIVCNIDVFGGDFQGGIEFLYALQESSNLTIGVAKNAYSAGFMILQGCKFRCATPLAKFQIHAPYAHTNGLFIEHGMTEKEYLEKQAQAFRHYHPRIMAGTHGTAKILREKSNILTENQIVLLMESEEVFDSMKALCFGFLDEII